MPKPVKPALQRTLLGRDKNVHTGWPFFAIIRKSIGEALRFPGKKNKERTDRPFSEKSTFNR